MKTAASLQDSHRERMLRPTNPYIKKYHQNRHESSDRQHTYMKMRMELKELEYKRHLQELEQVEYERMLRFDSYPYDSFNEDDLIRKSMGYDRDYNNGNCNKRHLD